MRGGEVVSREAHNLETEGSIPSPATKPAKCRTCGKSDVAFVPFYSRPGRWYLDCRSCLNAYKRNRHAAEPQEVRVARLAKDRKRRKDREANFTPEQIQKRREQFKKSKRRNKANASDNSLQTRSVGKTDSGE